MSDTQDGGGESFLGKSRQPGADSSRTGEAADLASSLAHEIGNLLDGSMRWLSLASRGLSGDLNNPDQVESVQQRLDSVRISLARMSQLVEGTLRSRALPSGSPLLGMASEITLGDAIAHAMDLIRPSADANAVRVESVVPEEVAAIPAGALYTVVLNALRNALESVLRAQSGSGGTGTVGLRSAIEHGRLVIDVFDDGCGPPVEAGGGSVFSAGFSTKSPGRGIGLSLSERIITDAGGTIGLHARDDRQDALRPGAKLRIEVPVPERDAPGLESA